MPIQLRNLVHLTALCCTLLTSVSRAETVTLENLPKPKGVAQYTGTTPQLHAATDKGLFVSRDEGRTWNLSYPFKLPATMINTTADGSLYAFVVAKGLLRIRSNEPMWRPVGNQFGGQVLTQLTAAADEPNRLVGLNQFGKIILSDDGGASWQKTYPGNRTLTPSAVQGEKLFTTYCQSCHGLEGVGETYTLEALTSEKYIMAPALDYSAHAWHHTDEALVQMILEGSQRTERMPAWSKQGLTKQDAVDLIAYMKSLWGKRELDCQGPKHMQCM